MKIDNIDVESVIKNTRQLLAAERDLSPALKSVLEMILLLVTVLLNRVTLNSKNSSKPPASDQPKKGQSQKIRQTFGWAKVAYRHDTAKKRGS